MSDWTDSIVGRKYTAGGGGVVLCTAYEPSRGFWLAPEGGGKSHSVDERAIGFVLYEVEEPSRVVDTRRRELLARGRCSRCGDVKHPEPCSTCIVFGLL